MTDPRALTETPVKVAPSTVITGVNGFHLEPRCRVCRNDGLRRKVNDLLATGASYAHIVRALGEDNAKLDRCDRITVDSVRNHCARHFPVQNVARATYREILERRAQETGVDFVEGVGTAITPMGYLETVVARAYETLVDEQTVVTVDQGAYAAKRLHELTRQDAGAEKMAQMHAEMNRIVAVMTEIIPPEYHQAILDKLDGKDTPVFVTAEPVRHREIEEFDPCDDEDFDEEDDE